MNTITTIVRLLLNSKTKNNLSKERIEYLLSAIAISTLSTKVIAESDSTNTKTYLVDVSKLAEFAFIEINDINQVSIDLADGSKGYFVSLGNGIFQFITTLDVTEFSFIISGSGVANTFASNVSFSGIAPIANIADISASDYANSYPSIIISRETGQEFHNLWSKLTAALDIDNSSDLSSSDLSSSDLSSFDLSSFDLSSFDLSSFDFDSFDFDSFDFGSNIGIVAGAGLGLLALAGGSSSSDSGTDLGGVISDGILKNAQVFLDANSDGILDWADSANGNGTWDVGEGEQWTLSDIDGSYTLTGVSDADMASGTLVGQAYIVDGVSQTEDIVSGGNVENIVMKAETSATVITPLTTIVNELKTTTITNDEILDILGLSRDIGDINDYNPFSTTNINTDKEIADALAFEKVATQIFTTANSLSDGINDIVGNDDINVDQIFTIAVREIVSIIEEEANKLETDRVELDLADLTTINSITAEVISSVDAEIKSIKIAAVTVDDVIVDGKIDEQATADALTAAQALITEGIDSTLSKEVSDLQDNAGSRIATINSDIDALDAFDTDAAELLLSKDANSAPTVTTAITAASTDEDAAYSYDASVNFNDV